MCLGISSLHKSKALFATCSHCVQPSSLIYSNKAMCSAECSQLKITKLGVHLYLLLARPDPSSTFVFTHIPSLSPFGSSFSLYPLLRSYLSYLASSAHSFISFRVCVFSRFLPFTFLPCFSVFSSTFLLAFLPFHFNSRTYPPPSPFLLLSLRLYSRSRFPHFISLLALFHSLSS